MQINTNARRLDAALRAAIGDSGLPPVLVRYVLQDILHEIGRLEQLAVDYEAQEPEETAAAPAPQEGEGGDNGR